MTEDRSKIDVLGADLDFAFEEPGGFAEILNGNDEKALDYGGFGRVFRWDEYAGFAFRFRTQRDGKNSFHRTHRAGERQFADHDKVIELIGFNLFAGREHRDGDGQIEARPFLLHVRRREIDGGPAHRRLEAGIRKGGHHAVARFFHRGVGQSHDDDNRVSPTDVDFDFNGERFDALNRSGTDAGEHGRHRAETPARGASLRCRWRSSSTSPSQPSRDMYSSIWIEMREKQHWRTRLSRVTSTGPIGKPGGFTEDLIYVTASQLARRQHVGRKTKCSETL